MRLGDGFWGNMWSGGVQYTQAVLWKPIHCIKCDKNLGIQKSDVKTELKEKGITEHMGAYLMGINTLKL